MKKLHLLFCICIASALFYFLATWFFDANWGFNLLSKKHWLFAWNKWQNGWVIKSSKDVMFLTSILLLLPALVLSWIVVYHFPLKKILCFPLAILKKRKLKKLQKLSLEAATGPKNIQEAIAAKKKPVAKAKGAVSSEKLIQIDGLRGKVSAKQPKKTEAEQADSGATAGKIPPKKGGQNKEQEALDRFNLWEKLAKEIEAEGIFILREMKISKFVVNTLAITQTGLFFLCEGPAEGAVWEVQEDANPPVWNTNKGSIPSPLRPMIEAKKLFNSYIQQKMPKYKDLDINACMILDHAHITNMDDLLKNLEEWDISVLRMGSCQTQDLPDTQALIEYIKAQSVSTQAMNDAMAIAIIDLMELENE